MNKIISLDISSSTVGWAMLSYDDNNFSLEEYGHIKPLKSTKGSLAFRASDYFDKISDLLKEKNPDFVVIEAYASRFQSRKSTARTIIVLSFFNELTSVASLKAIKIEPISYPVVTIRSCLSKFSGTKITSKEDCFKFIEKYFKNFTLRYKRTGSIKDECYDEADAIAVGLTHIIKEQKNGKRLNLR
jgi:Holliday junction resolvasome RuvABC endonuclease subunit